MSEIGKVFSSAFDSYTKEIQARAEAALKRVYIATYKEYFKDLEADMKALFEKTIDEFYDDYKPREGEYIRSHSLYALLRTELSLGDEEGEQGLFIDFDPGEMSHYRNGYAGDDGLYDLVFRRGWHGGADKISDEKQAKWGVHPSPGTPYYRKPKKAGYPRWGRKAERMSPSPLNRMKQYVREYEKNISQAKFNAIFQREWQKVKF